jgi:precorrin-2 dehydrogenase/sirohydrochlorin ferrochelatase
MSRLYPAMLRLEGRTCVVIGGGRVAARKVRGLLEARAVVRVIAPELASELLDLAQCGALTWERRCYRRGDLAGAVLAVAATDSRSVNADVAREAWQLQIPTAIVDDSEASTLQVPAVLERDGLLLAVSTSGRSPAYARRVREQLEQFLSPERLSLLEIYADLRAALLERERRAPALAPPTIDEQALELLRQGRATEARDLIREHVCGAPAGGR